MRANGNGARSPSAGGLLQRTGERDTVMKMQRVDVSRAAALSLGLSISVALLASCAAPSEEIEDPSGTELWVDLFDGESLDGWTRLGGEAEYRVDSGQIVGTTQTGTPNTFLATETSYGDFALELEYKVDPAINSGVQIRSESRPEYQAGRVHGYQIEIDPSERAWSAGIYDEARRGWLYPLTLNPEATGAFRQNEWNHLYIEAMGDTIRTWLNDVPVAHLIDDLTPEGFIALQVHSVSQEDSGREIRWRNIRIRTRDVPVRDGSVPYIADTVPNRLSEAEAALGWRLAWNGKDTTGWRGAHAEAFPEGGWEIADGQLTVLESGGGEARNGGDIVTEDEYSAFEFQLEFLLSEGANSGIKYFVTEGYESGGSAIGVEYQLLDDERHPDATQGRDGNRTLASLYDLMTAEKSPRFVNPPGQWNHARLVVHPNRHVEHWLNHQKVLEYELGSPEFHELVQISKYRDWEGFGDWESGHLLLQDHGNRVSFRSIKIRDLSDS